MPATIHDANVSLTAGAIAQPFPLQPVALKRAAHEIESWEGHPVKLQG